MDLSASVASVVALELAAFMRQFRHEQAKSRRADREYYDQHFAKVNRRIDSVEFRLASAGSSSSSSDFASPHHSHHSSPKTPVLFGDSRDVLSNFDQLDVMNRQGFMDDLGFGDDRDANADFAGLQGSAADSSPLFPDEKYVAVEELKEASAMKMAGPQCVSSRAVPSSHPQMLGNPSHNVLLPHPLHTPCNTANIPTPVHDPKVCALCSFSFQDKKCVNSQVGYSAFDILADTARNICWNVSSHRVAASYADMLLMRP